MSSFFYRRTAEDPLLPSYTSVQGSSTQAGSASSERPPAYALHSSNRPPGVLRSLPPHVPGPRLNGTASPSSTPPRGPGTQAGTSPSVTASDQKHPDTRQEGPHCVEVCPHEFLSFERFQRIMNLPGFKGSDKRLDALIAGPDHFDFYALKNRRCIPRATSLDGLETFSDYTSSGPHGLVLTIMWVLPNNIVPSNNSSRSALRDLLRGLDLKLCPHKKFDDPWMVEVLYRMAHPSEKFADPLDQWEADAEFAMDASGVWKAQCQHCSTCYEMMDGVSIAMLYVTRNLGKGKSPRDPIWLAQCGVEP